MRSFAAFLESSDRSNTDRSGGSSTIYEDAVMSLSDSEQTADEAMPPDTETSSDVDCVVALPLELSPLQIQLQRHVRWQEAHGPPAVMRSRSNSSNNNNNNNSPTNSSSTGGSPWQWEHEDGSKEELRIVGTATPPPVSVGSPPRPYSIKIKTAQAPPPPAGSFPSLRANDDDDNGGGVYEVYDSRLPALVEDMPTIYEEDAVKSLLVNPSTDDSADSTLQSKDRSTSGSLRPGASRAANPRGGPPCWQNPRWLWILIGFLFIGLGGTLMLGLVWQRNDGDDNNRAREIGDNTPPLATWGPTAAPTTAPAMTSSPPSPVVEDTPLWEYTGLVTTNLAATSLALSQDGTVLAAAHFLEGSQVYYQEQASTADAGLWQRLGPPLPAAWRVALVDNGERLVLLETDGGVAQIYNQVDDDADTTEAVTWQAGFAAATQTSSSRVALAGNGDLLAVGDPILDDVQVYVRESSSSSSSGTATWDFQAVPTLGQGDTGAALATSRTGQTLVVGAPQNGIESIVPGMVRVYRWIASTASWRQVGQTLVGARDGDAFGQAVALSDDGNLLAIGAPAVDVNVDGQVVRNAGQVRIYQLDAFSGLWERFGTLDGRIADQGLGSSLALAGDGTLIAVGSASGALQTYRSVEMGGSWVAWGDGWRVSAPVGSPLLVMALANNGRVLALFNPDRGVDVYEAGAGW